MATRIPLPDPNKWGDFTTGMNAGSSLFTSLMNPQLKIQEMALNKPLYEAHAKKYLAEANEKEMIGNVIRSLLGMENPTPGAQGSVLPPGIGFQNPLYYNMQDPNQSQPGGSVMGGMSQPVPQPRLDFNKMGPEQLAVLEKFIGLKPNLETNTQKSDRAYQDFVKKEQYKENRPLDVPTNEIVNAAQKTLVATNNIMPLVNDYLKEEIPGKYAPFSPNQRALVKSMAGLSVDEVIAALGLSKDQESTHLVKQMFNREFGEDEKAFKSRVTYTMKRLAHKAEEAEKILKNKKVEYTEKPDLSRLVEKLNQSKGKKSKGSDAKQRISLTVDGQEKIYPVDIKDVDGFMMANQQYNPRLL